LPAFITPTTKHFASYQQKLGAQFAMLEDVTRVVLGIPRDDKVIGKFSLQTRDETREIRADR
jgi:hypothetical protein